MKIETMTLSTFINGQWLESSGKPLPVINPASGQILDTLAESTPDQVNAAFSAARSAFKKWSQAPIEDRQKVLFEFAKLLQDHKESLAETISLEVGKPYWESLTEVQAMIGKIAISIEAYQVRCASFPGGAAVTRFKPHGVMSVLGPFNFPGHLPNGHIVPALLAGNTIVLKPSNLTPLTAVRMVKLWEEAGLPAGVLNLVQGAGEVGKQLVEHKEVNGVLFTGGLPTGLKIRQALVNRPDVIVALEMGGNNPLIVSKVKDLDAAVIAIIQSAYLTSGQRCTCARRLILPESSEAELLIKRLSNIIPTIKVGAYKDEPKPFMGPLVSPETANRVADFKTGRALVQPIRGDSKTGFVTPGLFDVTDAKDRVDCEIFGPLLQVIRTKDFDSAIEEANNTQYGLSAGLLSEDMELFKQFRAEIRAGIVNWNQQITGASSAAPFGGVGMSGNHRPSAFFAADYCAYPVASIEQEALKLPDTLPHGVQLL